MHLSNADRTLAITIGPAPAGSLAATSARFVRALNAGYSAVQVLGTKPQQVNGLPALSTYGQAVNAKSVKLRFVSVAVAAPHRNYTLTTFTAFDTDPAVTLPQLNAVIDGFDVLSGQ